MDIWLHVMCSPKSCSVGSTQSSVRVIIENLKIFSNNVHITNLGYAAHNYLSGQELS
jgi:hypothetical protein